MSEAKKVRVGVVGAGFVTVRGHIPAYKRLDNVSVEAICDINGDRARAVAEQFGIPHVFTDFDEMLNTLEFDLISIGTPNRFHAPQTIAALEKGCHVLCEKPMALTVEEAQAMAEASRRTGRKLTLGLHHRYRPEALALKPMCEAGELGEIYYARATMMRRAGIPGYGSHFTNKELAGGGCLYDIGVHILDLTMYFMGFPEPVSVSGQTFSVFGPQRKKLGGWGADILPGKARFDVDDMATALVKFANGAVLHLEVAWAFHGRSEERVQLVGTEGGAEIYPALFGRESALRVYRDWNDRALDIIPELPRFEASQQARQIEDFVNHLDDPTPPVVTPEHGVILTRILSGIYRSAETGEEVKV
ncbi:MAG: Gfo/Idh/MocA family oxidoreductase [Anaerolineae bacterium]